MAPWGKAAAGPSGAVTSDAGTPYGAGSAAATPKLRTETRSRCCCCHVARGVSFFGVFFFEGWDGWMESDFFFSPAHSLTAQPHPKKHLPSQQLLLTLLSLFLLGTLGTSVASLALGHNNLMTRTKSVVELDATSLAKFAESGDNLIKLAKAKNSGPTGLDVRSGYLGFKDGSNADTGRGQPLKVLGAGRGAGWVAGGEPGKDNNAPWIVGYVLMAMLLLSIVAAALGLLSACCCGCSGCGLATFAIPFGLALLGTLLAYWIIVMRAIDRYAHDQFPALEKQQKVFQIPGWAWYLGLISSGLWLLAGTIGCCMPKKTKTVTTLA
jgi:hypothetical protein